MTDLLPKPKHGDYGWWTPDTFAMAERDYYKRLAEFAIGTLNEITHCETIVSARGIAKIALSTIKGSQS